MNKKNKTKARLSANSLAETASKLGFTPSGVWDIDTCTYSTLYLGDSMEIHLVDGQEVFIELHGHIRKAPNIKTGQDLINIVGMLSTVSVLQVMPGIYDIAPTREEVYNAAV